MVSLTSDSEIPAQLNMLALLLDDIATQYVWSPPDGHWPAPSHGHPLAPPQQLSIAEGGASFQGTNLKTQKFVLMVHIFPAKFCCDFILELSPEPTSIQLQLCLFFTLELTHALLTISEKMKTLVILRKILKNSDTLHEQ